MARVGYRSGDIVAVEAEPPNRTRDLVIARIGPETTLKCFRRAAPDRIELQPRSSDPEHQAIVTDAQTADWEIHRRRGGGDGPGHPGRRDAERSRRAESSEQSPRNRTEQGDPTGLYRED